MEKKIPSHVAAVNPLSVRAEMLCVVHGTTQSLHCKDTENAHQSTPKYFSKVLQIYFSKNNIQFSHFKCLKLLQSTSHGTQNYS